MPTAATYALQALKKRYILYVFLLVAVLPCLAQVSNADYLGFLQPAARNELLAKGSLGASGGSFREMTLWRGASFAENLVKTVGDRPATLAAERWFVLTPPRTSTKEERDLRIWRGFTSFTTMKGLRTRSVIFAGSEDFITDSYCVSDAESRRRLADPVDTRAPEAATYTLYGREALVGEVYYEMRFASHGNWFEVSLTNLVPMKTFLVRLVRPRELLTVFCVVPTADGLLLYALALANTPMLPGIAPIERASLESRMMAIAAWFQGNVERP